MLKSKKLYLILSIVLAVISTILILVFEEIDDGDLGSSIASVFLILSVVGIAVFCKKPKKNNNENIQPQITQTKTEEKQFVNCEYCGGKNQINNTKCSNCGAKLK